MTTHSLKISNNLSDAWLEVLQQIVDDSGTELSPLVLSLTNFEEDLKMKNLLNTALKKTGFDSVETVSETIFPQSLYELVKNDREKLFKIYKEQTYLRLKKIDRRNSCGTYFQRMVAYGDTEINQLENIITSINSKVKRRSKLQISIFDPEKDHKTGMFQGFPCLQHVTFYKSETGGLILNSFYAIQYLFQRSYGNWLGLINLGKFVAEQAELPFERLNCFVGVEKLDHLTKKQAKIIIAEMNS